jgi:hypothetical protein
MRSSWLRLSGESGHTAVQGGLAQEGNPVLTEPQLFQPADTDSPNVPMTKAFAEIGGADRISPRL